MHDWTIRRMSRPVLGVTGLLGLLGLSGGLLLACAPRQGGWSFPEAESWRRVGMRSGRFARAVADVPESPAGLRTAPHFVSDADSEDDPVAVGLFARNCATCHGIDGSGQGSSVLDRPARNFKDGGFSFGNTADAIFNTISFGIPGTPMPAFAEALGEGERWQLADFVRTLGPPVEEVDEEDTIMTVTDTPLIVRGILPPIVEGAPMRPRGLLIGLPGGEGPGLTFEYRIDDVRLLGVRQGGFVARTDWNDRGGTPLKPLGGLIWVDGAGDPPAMFSLESTAHDGSTTVQSLTARLIRSEPDSLGYEFLNGDASCVGAAFEGVEPCSIGSLSGFARGFMLQDMGIASRARLCMRLSLPPESLLVDTFTQLIHGRGCEWRVFRRSDGVHECIGIALGSFGQSESGSGPALSIREAQGSLDVVLALTTSEELRTRGIPMAHVSRVFTTDWTPTVRAAFADVSR